MKFYFAPMEGITGYVFRNAFHSCFPYIDKYFMPFLHPKEFGNFSAREKEELLPRHNKDLRAVPQILTNDSMDFIKAAKRLEEYGYREVNLNLGCPSKPVVAKGRGAGFLAEPRKLDRFLTEIFEGCGIEISVKTRLGIEDADEFGLLLDIYNKYPLKELIIHPRVQQDFYQNPPKWDAFRVAFEKSKHSVCYNGSIFTVQDYQRFTEAFPEVGMVMLGRGLLRNPLLIGGLQHEMVMEPGGLREFHDKLYEGYRRVIEEEWIVLIKMKEIWSYMRSAFLEYQDDIKRVWEVKTAVDYEQLVKVIFSGEK